MVEVCLRCAWCEIEATLMFLKRNKGVIRVSRIMCQLRLVRLSSKVIQVVVLWPPRMFQLGSFKRATILSGLSI